MSHKGRRHTDKTPELAGIHARLSLPSGMYTNKHAITTEPIYRTATSYLLY